MDSVELDEFEHCDEQLWRYMDLWKFADLITNRKLHLTKLYDFEDKHEGCLPMLDVPLYIADEVRDAMARDPKANEADERAYVIGQIANGNRFRRNSFASCWFASNYQSAAMWDLYCPHSLGDAIQTTEDALLDALDHPENLDFGFEPVRYLDFEYESMYDMQAKLRESGKPSYVLSPVQCKRQEFVHEREWRVWVVAHQVDGKLLRRSPDADPFEESVRLNIDPRVLIKRILVPPRCKPWQVGLVTTMLKQFGLENPVHRSTLLDLPDW